MQGKQDEDVRKKRKGQDCASDPMGDHHGMKGQG
jgi:hypothetical protein